MPTYPLDTDNSVLLPIFDLSLNGLLHLVSNPAGIIIFVHGSGSGRLSSRNQYVAKRMQQANFATLLFDLLTLEEEEIDVKTREYRFDIPMLAKRLIAVTDWVKENAAIKEFPIGYFGASTGAAAALIGAANRQEAVNAIVSRGGRPDLAGPFLSKVKAPTLLLVGGDDVDVIKLNQLAYDHLHCEKKLEIIEGATHLFEEAGKLCAVADSASAWFSTYLLK